MSRSCDGCTECCQGHLRCTVLGRELTRGSPCHYVGRQGCTVYEARPVSPCQTYKCVWLMNDDLPLWMKPEHSGVIVTKRPYGNEGKWFWDVIETRGTMSTKVLRWLMIQHINTRLPMRIQIEGGQNLFGSAEFIRECQDRNDQPALSA